MDTASHVTRDDLHTRFTELEARLTWKIVCLLGVQIVVFSSITAFL